VVALHISLLFTHSTQQSQEAHTAALTLLPEPELREGCQLIRLLAALHAQPNQLAMGPITRRISGQTEVTVFRLITTGITQNASIIISDMTGACSNTALPLLRFTN
jgi:hypothetical protein